MKTHTSITAKLWLPLAMTLLYVAALGCRLTGAVSHEWIGVAFCVLCVLHMAVNRRWFKNIPKGRYSLRRHADTVLNILLPITMTALVVTGILGSRHVFGFLNFTGGMDIRQLHTFAAYWGLMLLGIHTGLQWVKVLAGVRSIPGLAKLLAMKGVQPGLLLLTVCYGVWASFDRAMGSKLFLGFSFDFWDSARPEILFYTHNLAILALYAVAAHYVRKLTVNNAATSRDAAATETIRP